MTGTLKTVQIDLSADIADQAQSLLESHGITLEEAISKFLHFISQQKNLPKYLVEVQILALGEKEICKRIEEIRQKLNERDGLNTWKDGSETVLEDKFGELCRGVDL